jgi:hypothetical protein
MYFYNINKKIAWEFFYQLGRIETINIQQKQI